MSNKYKLILLFLISLGLTISIVPDIYRLSITPKDTFFPMIHNHTGDYFYYLSLIGQGIEGNILLTTRMTPEHFAPALAQTFFAILGLTAKIIGIDNIAIYFLARILIGTGLLVTIIFLAKKVYSKNNYILVASFLAIFSTSFWIPTADNTKALGVLQYLTHWTKLDPIIRTTYLPHHLLSTLLGIISIILLYSALKEKNLRKGITAGLLAAVGGFIYFATFVNLLGALGMLVLFLMFESVIARSPAQTGRRGNLSNRLSSHLRGIPPRVPIESGLGRNDKSILIILTYILLSSTSLIYLFLLSKSGFPWSAYDRVGENFTLYLPFFHYLYSLGPAFILTLIGLPIIFHNFSFLNGFLLCWALFPFLGLFILSKIFWQYGNVYYLESSNYIPLGILSIYGLMRIYLFLGKKRLYAIVGISLLAIYFIPPLSSSIVAESNRLTPGYYNQFIPKDVMDGLSWLDKFTPKESVVLSGGFFGNLIPAFSHNRVVYGHPANTYQSDKKIKDTDIFFAQDNTIESKKIIARYKVSYIFYSRDNDPPKDGFINSLGLNLIYKNPQVVIFKTAGD